jgi:hypothetical protein
MSRFALDLVEERIRVVHKASELLEAEPALGDFLLGTQLEVLHCELRTVERAIRNDMCPSGLSFGKSIEHGDDDCDKCPIYDVCRQENVRLKTKKNFR